MAGRGSRLAGQEASLPKPLISVAGHPMLAWALQSLLGLETSNLIFVALQEHEEQFQLSHTIEAYAGSQSKLVLIPEVTAGQLCTVMAAREWLKPQDSILIANCDTYVVSNLVSDVENADPGTKGLISVAALPGSQWSFARTDDSGEVVEVAEKVRISNHASTGLYHFSHTGEFLDAADLIVREETTTRGEYYVISVYQKYIQQGKKIILSHASEVWDMGTPDTKSTFESYVRTNELIPKPVSFGI